MRDEAKAQVALPYVLLISGIVIEIAIAGAIVAYFAWNTTQEEALLARAEGAAYSGIQDALKQIGENKELGGAAYCLMVGSDGVDVQTTRTTDALSSTYLYTVSAVGAARAAARGARTELMAELVVSSSTGKMFLKDLRAVPVSRSYGC